METMEQEVSETQSEIDKTPKDLMVEKLLASEEVEHKQPFGSQQIQVVSPRTITGHINNANTNKGAIAWGHHGLVAYGCNTYVVVIDTTNVQPVQCLDHHKSIVNKVLWSPVVRNKVDDTASVELVSADSTGHIIHWDITIGSPLVVLQDGNKPVLAMEWVNSHVVDKSDLFLAALHSPFYFIIWDIKKQFKLWKKSFTDTLLSFNFNPFNTSQLAFLCPDCILFVDDFNVGKIPSTNGRKYYISSPRGSDIEDNLRTRDRLKRLMKGLVVGETKPRPDDIMTVSECLQMLYHRSLCHHLLLLYPRDILLIDLHISQTVGIVSVEKAMSPLVQMVVARQRDVLYCLHDTGCVSVKVRRKCNNGTLLLSPLDAPAESVSSIDVGGYSTELLMCYEHKCQSEVIRQIKGSKVVAMALNPVSENKIVLLLTSGKLVHLELEYAGVGSKNTPLSLSHMFGPSTDETCVIPPLRLLATGLLSAVTSPINVIRMCPPLTTRNRAHYVPLMATGTQTGLVQIFNMAQGTIEQEFALHNYPVRGIEWTGLSSFLSYAYSSQTGRVRNELILTEVNSGQSVQVQRDKSVENPIDIVRVSPLRQYFVVVLKDGPFELWDLKGLSLLRTMPKKFPFVTALEWSPIHSIKSLQTKKKADDSVSVITSATSPVGEPSTNVAHADLVAREHLVFSDTESQLYHFSVEGSVVRDGIKIPPEAGVSLVTCIAFKSNQIVQADVDGCLNIWDLKARSSRNVHTGRGWVRKMRFSPGKGNLKLLILYSDGVDIVDLKNGQYERIAQVKCPKDMVKIVDLDWAAPDAPVFATEDGCLRIMDTKLTTNISPLTDYTFQDPVSCPSLLPPAVLAQLQFLLSSQFWKDAPVFEKFTVEDGIPLDQLQAVNEQVSMLSTDTLKSCTLGTAEQSLVASLLLHDQEGIDFWTVALYYLQVSSIQNKERLEGKEVPRKPIQQCESFSASDLKRVNQYPMFQPLDTCYDILCDAYSYQRMQLERVNVHEWRRGDYKHTQRVVERLILLGEMDRAVQLLLETDIDNPSYYTDAIKACLVATIQSTGAAQSTIKLVATNLIANGQIWEGVQLLCLIGKGLDGCRYLSSYGLWESAVWLAKSILPFNETLEVLKKWTDHLCSVGDKELAVLVLLSLGQFEKVFELLLSLGHYARAGLFLLALQDIGLTIDNKSLISSVKSAFCIHLNTTGNWQAAEYLSKLQLAV